MPRIEWFYNFDSRNIILNKKFAQNIKRCRANVTKEVITYFENLERTLERIEAMSFVNYDESS